MTIDSPSRARLCDAADDYPLTPPPQAGLRHAEEVRE